VKRSGRSTPVGRDNAKAKLQGIRQGRDSLRTAGILTNNNGIFPIGHVYAYPPGEEWFGNEIIDGTLEKALHLRGVQVNGYDVVHAGNVEQIGYHASCYGTAMLLLLGLAGVGEVGHDGWTSQTGPYGSQRGRRTCD
jgi:hypothetical protein